MDRVLLTKTGAERLQAELKELKSVERPKVIHEIATARAHGDLSENAEYHAAREQQSFIEGRIKELEGNLGIAEVIDISKLNVQGKVVFGALVKLYEEGGDADGFDLLRGEGCDGLDRDEVEMVEVLQLAVDTE